MKIRPKVFALLSAVFLLLAGVEWAVGKLVLLPRFEEIERDGALTDMRRIGHVLEQELVSLQVSASDWGNWADTYRYAIDRNPTFAESNLTDMALSQLRVSVLAIVGPDGRIIWSKAVEPGSSAPLTLDVFSGPSLPTAFHWAAELRPGQPASGLIATSGGVLMAASAPILDGHMSGPAHGAVIMGRFLTPAKVAEIGAKAQTAVEMVTTPPPASTADDAAGLAGARLTADENTIHVFRAFADIRGRPVVTLRVDVPRRIAARAHATVAYTTGFTVGAAIVVLVLLIVMLNSIVLHPLASVTRHAIAVGKGDDLALRLDSGRRDEIGVLAREFDAMVKQLAESRRQLIDHSFDAGMSESSRGVIHNLGNAMTPLCVRLAKLQESLQAAPTADVELAVAELAGPVEDRTRRADLLEFLRLTSGELVRSIRTAEGDAEVVARQASIVQHSLAEQLRSSRGAPVLEPVDLPTVIQQSLDIVPDGARERLDVDLDASLRSLGVVRLARTVLRLVLQNLIINASEAVRAAGRGRGALKVTAGLQRQHGCETLLLECTDTGVGIAAEHLERIFERDFSTKRAHGNFGIGLHWCATALAALGGRIWATSRGIGQGATFYVQMPVANVAAAHTDDT